MNAIKVFRIFLLIVLSMVTVSSASNIQTADIVAIPSHLTGSGNGTLNLRMFTYSGSEIHNAAGLFNGDNANNTLPQGGGEDIHLFDESYVTTAGELKAYYNLNFQTGSIHEIVLFLDLNESGINAELYNTLAKLDVVLNPTGVPNPYLNDVSGGAQAAINQSYTGGTTIANLNPQPAANLPVNSEGAGFADYAIFTGIDPFTLNDSDVLLFNISMNTLDNGAEEIFLSGTYAPSDVIVPEPATILLFSLGLVVLRRKL